MQPEQQNFLVNSMDHLWDQSQHLEETHSQLIKKTETQRTIFQRAIQKHWTVNRQSDNMHYTLFNKEIAFLQTRQKDVFEKKIVKT